MPKARQCSVDGESVTVQLLNQHLFLLESRNCASLYAVADSELRRQRLVGVGVEMFDGCYDEQPYISQLNATSVDQCMLQCQVAFRTRNIYVHRKERKYFKVVAFSPCIVVGEIPISV